MYLQLLIVFFVVSEFNCAPGDAQNLAAATTQDDPPSGKSAIYPPGDPYVPLPLPPNAYGGPSMVEYLQEPDKHSYYDPLNPDNVELIGHHSAVMKVEDTKVTCHKSFMTIQMWFSAPFYGFIYPYGQFEKCLLLVGKGEKEVTMQLGHDQCGRDAPGQHTYTKVEDPVISHRLMIQWDRELVEEWDSSVVVRCDRPDNYNKTIKFDLSTIDNAAYYKHATHPGPKMWMEIQRGEGPKAPPLEGAVYLGETLTLVFTIADDLLSFDTNVITCWALDGSSEKKQIEWVGKDTALTRGYIGELAVIENGCSVRPKVFGHFEKEVAPYQHGQSVTRYAYFKAFRFPTSMRVLLQCDVQVCYYKCPELLPCREQYDPRSGRKRRAARHRRNVGETTGKDPKAEVPEKAEKELDRVALFRSIEVLMPEEKLGTLRTVSVQAATTKEMVDCISMATFYATAASLAVIIVLLMILAVVLYKRNPYSSSLMTPQK